MRAKKLARCSRLRRTATSCTRSSRAAGSSAIARRSSASGALPSARHATTESPPRAPHREIVADQAERKVVGDGVGAGYEEEQARGDEPERVDRQPEAMLLEIGLELRPQHIRRPFLADVVGIEQAGDGLPAQVPEEPLLGDALGHPAHRARLNRASQPWSPAPVSTPVRPRRRSRSASASISRNRARSRRKNRPATQSPGGGRRPAGDRRIPGRRRRCRARPAPHNRARDGRGRREPGRHPLLKIR